MNMNQTVESVTNLAVNVTNLEDYGFEKFMKGEALPAPTFTQIQVNSRFVGRVSLVHLIGNALTRKRIAIDKMSN